MHTSAHIHRVELNQGAVFVNMLRPRPLFIQEGLEFVTQLLQQAKTKEGLAGISQAFKDTDLIDLLIQHHLIVKDEPLNLTHIANSRPQQMSLYLLVTQKCNLACTYCLAGRKSYRQSAQMNLSVAKRAIGKAIQELSKGGYLEIVFFGGEPLLNWRLIDEICKWVIETRVGVTRNCRIHFHITTNMTILSHSIIDLIRRFDISLLTDIDGLKLQHDLLRPFVNGRGSFDSVIENIHRLQDEGIHLAYRTTVTHQNVDNLGQIAKSFVALGSNSLAFPLLTPINSDKNLVGAELLFSADQYIQGLQNVLDQGIPKELVMPLSRYLQHLNASQSDPYNCGAPLGRTPVVTAAGNVYPCIYLVGQDSYEIGNILSPSFSYYQNPVIEKMSKIFHVDHNQKCRSCEIRYFCRGGCPIMHLATETLIEDEKQIAYIEEMLCQVPAKLLNMLLNDMVCEVRAQT